jgi:hypothetical protein
VRWLCSDQCDGASDPTQCRATCEATGECDSQCRPVVDGDCYTHCIECCGGSCKAQANMGCQTTCQEEEFEDWAIVAAWLCGTSRLG